MTVIDADHDHDGSGAHAPRPDAASAGSWFSSLVTSPWRFVLLAVAGVWAVDAGGTDDGAGLCIFRRCTGGYCPGCGVTRSARHLTRGQFAASWQDHPIIPLIAVQAAVAAGLFAVVRPLRSRLAPPTTIVVAAAVNGTLLVVIWAVRLANGSIPRFF
ncbi:MAG: DUF2752 domain-containing protein [Ilumatobacter sp.]|uniref:DUF2752 domain-containing protein n=1 Tax=Ilumatobacter sp. TaxID=1967498 RepID=UPI003297EC81